MNQENKIWIFQANRNLSEEEETAISNKLMLFLSSWVAHGAKVKSQFEILNHKFIIIETDECYTKVTGCSIDSLNQCIRSIDSEYNLELLNRLWVSYDLENGKINSLPLNEFKIKIKNKEIHPETFIYDLSISSAKDFQKRFRIPLKESWAKRFL